MHTIMLGVSKVEIEFGRTDASEVIVGKYVKSDANSFGRNTKRCNRKRHVHIVNIPKHCWNSEKNQNLRQIDIQTEQNSQESILHYPRQSKWNPWQTLEETRL